MVTTRDAAKQTFKVALAQPPIADPHICGVMRRKDQGTGVSQGLWGGSYVLGEISEPLDFDPPANGRGRP